MSVNCVKCELLVTLQQGCSHHYRSERDRNIYIFLIDKLFAIFFLIFYFYLAEKSNTPLDNIFVLYNIFLIFS